ncbi:DUF4232 domain-containing protein [Amycolatopsis japonica]
MWKILPAGRNWGDRRASVFMYQLTRESNAIMRNNLTGAGLIFSGIATVLALSACDAGGAGPAASPTGALPEAPTAAGGESHQAVAEPSETAKPSVKPAGTGSTGSAGGGLCKAADVRLSLGDGDTGAGRTTRPLIITNTSGHLCGVQGFPGVSYVAGEDNHQVGAAAFRAGAKGEIVRLNHGESAASVVVFANVANYDAGICKPTSVTALRVYLPQDTASTLVKMSGTGCANDKVAGDQLTVNTVHKAG